MLLTLQVADNIASLTNLLAGTKMQSANLFHCLDHHESSDHNQYPAIKPKSILLYSRYSNFIPVLLPTNSII